MKKIYTLLIALLIVGQSFGQIKEKQVNISLGVQPCLTSNIDNIKAKNAAKLWKKFFKPYGKVKRNRKAKEYFSTGVKVNRIKSGDPVDVYMKIVEATNGVNLNLCIDLGTAFVSKDMQEEYTGAEKLLDEFLIYVRGYQLNEKLDEEEDILKDLESELKSKRKKNKKLHSSIEKYKQKIVEAEENIEKNLQEQEDLKKSIELQNEKVKQVQEDIEKLKK